MYSLNADFWNWVTSRCARNVGCDVGWKFCKYFPHIWRLQVLEMTSFHHGYIYVTNVMHYITLIKTWLWNGICIIYEQICLINLMAIKSFLWIQMLELLISLLVGFTEWDKAIRTILEIANHYNLQAKVGQSIALLTLESIKSFLYNHSNCRAPPRVTLGKMESYANFINKINKFLI